MTPIDVVKTRIQVDNAFGGLGMLSAGRKLVAAEGAGGLLQGFGPTAVGCVHCPALRLSRSFAGSQVLPSRRAQILRLRVRSFGRMKYDRLDLPRRYWKKTLIQWSGGPEAAVANRTAIYIVGASIAEFFVRLSRFRVVMSEAEPLAQADIALAPCEATRIRLVSDRTYASGFLPAMARMAKEGGRREFCAPKLPT